MLSLTLRSDRYLWCPLDSPFSLVPPFLLLTSIRSLKTFLPSLRFAPFFSHWVHLLFDPSPDSSPFAGKSPPPEQPINRHDFFPLPLSPPSFVLRVFRSLVLVFSQYPSFNALYFCFEPRVCNKLFFRLSVSILSLLDTCAVRLSPVLPPSWSNRRMFFLFLFLSSPCRKPFSSPSPPPPLTSPMPR